MPASTDCPCDGLLFMINRKGAFCIGFLFPDDHYVTAKGIGLYNWNITTKKGLCNS